MNAMQSMERVVCEKLRLVLVQHLSERGFYFSRNEGEVEVFVDQRVCEMVLRISTAILSYEGKEEVSEEKSEEHVPATWWQHFKERWFPRWLEHRFPVKYRVIEIGRRTTIKRYRLCPHVDIRAHGPHLEWMVAR